MNPMTTSEPVACTVNVAYGSQDPAGLPASIGVPFPRGMLNDPVTLTARSPSGERRPAAGRVLARHPDGSVRWCLVSFGAREAGSHEIKLDGPPVIAESAMTLTETNGVWMLDNGRLRLTVCETGPGVLGELVCDGYSYLTTPENLQFVVDDAATRYESCRVVRVMEQSPLRVRLRVEGAHHRPDGNRCLNYRLDIELWAGWPTVRLDYHYFNLEPGQPAQTIRKIAFDTAWNLGEETERHFLQRSHGLFYVSRHVLNPDPVAIAADFEHADPHVEDPAMLLDDVEYPFYLNPPLVWTHDWLGVGDGHHAVYARMEDFCTAKPNRLTSTANRLAVEVWPSTAEPLDLPQGRSRRQTLTLAFVAHETGEANSNRLPGAPIQASLDMAALLQAPIYEGRACASPEWIAYCGEFRQDKVLPAGRHLRIEANLSSFMRLDMPVTKFDVGDTDSDYNNSYALSSVSLVRPLAGAPELPRIFPRSQPTQTYIDCHEPVWTNNEYDIIHAFCSELMRTGRFELWHTLRLIARHNIEVDFLHYSDHRWLHRATPAHSVRHTTTGAYPSHFWTQGLLEYYCLTGDPDALEVACALGEKIIENFTDPAIRAKLWGFNREIGWPILALACLVDITGELRFQQLLDEMVAFVVGFDRGGYRGALPYIAGANGRANLTRQFLDSFAGTSGGAPMMEGIEIYADMTGRAEVGEWLARFSHDLADEMLNAAREGKVSSPALALAIGYERTGDRRFLELMTLLLDVAYWNTPGIDGGATVKWVAMSYRGFTRLLGHAGRHGMLDRYEYPGWRALSQRDPAPTGEDGLAFQRLPTNFPIEP